MYESIIWKYAIRHHKIYVSYVCGAPILVGKGVEFACKTVRSI